MGGGDLCLLHSSAATPHMPCLVTLTLAQVIYLMTWALARSTWALETLEEIVFSGGMMMTMMKRKRMMRNKAVSWEVCSALPQMLQVLLWMLERQARAQYMISSTKEKIMMKKKRN